MRTIISIIALSLLSIFTSCKKVHEIPFTNNNPDLQIALNDMSDSIIDTLFVSRAKTTAFLQISALTHTTEMKRIYVFKKTVTTLKTGDYQTFKDSSFKVDGNGNYYYAIPNDQKNNTVLNLMVNLGLKKLTPPVVDTIVTDNYFFAITGDSNYENPPNADGVLVGPAQMCITYGALTQSIAYRINNPKGIKPSAFDLTTFSNKSGFSVDSLIDLKIKATVPDSLWEKSFTAGATSKTTYVKMPASFDYTHATDISVKNAYKAAAINATSTETDVATDDVYIAKIRGKENYVLMKVTFISKINGLLGPGSEYMEFTLKR